ncbi:MAG TPA: regulatory protein RecX [Spirochaetia bacterium]|nr:regulatory protein RecX [Spirochaetia bacterium]
MRVWEESPFHEDDELDLSRWNEILAKSALIQARGQALSLLARSEHSRFLLRQKLLQRNFQPTTIASALDELEASGALSDERYAESWVRSRLRGHPEGRSRLVGGLRSRGIDASLADDAVATVLEEESISMLESARSYVERITRRKALPAPRIADRLYRRGFSRAVVQQVLSGLGDESDADE